MAITISGDGITSDNILSLAASKLTGTLPDANAPSGSVIQVVSSVINKSSHVTTTSSTWTAMGSEFQASITPTFASSKIVVLANITSYTETGYGYYRIDRAISGLSDVDLSGGMGLGLGGIDADRYAVTPLFWVDSPNTTSQITYKIMMACANGTFYAYHDSNKTQFILMEIAA